jgi:hypothetical protein
MFPEYKLLWRELSTSLWLELKMPQKRTNIMAVNPKPAKEKRSPTPVRQNAQSDHEGSAHDPEEFDVINPAKQVPSTPAKRDT